MSALQKIFQKYVDANPSAWMPRQAAAHHVAHSRAGHKLARRFPNARPEELVSLVHEAGVNVTKGLQNDDTALVSIAKAVVQSGNSLGLSEHEATAAITAYAKRRHPELSEASAFSAVFCASTPQALELRKFVDICKGQYNTIRIGEVVGHVDMLMPQGGLPELSDYLDYNQIQNSRGGRAALAQGGQQFDEPDDGEPDHRWSDDEGDDPEYDAMWEEAGKRHAADPSRTREQWFSKIYSSPQFAALAKADRVRSRRKLQKSLGYAR
jgi:hypothetical protein